MKTVGMDFSGGLCGSTSIEVDKMNEFKCAPGYALLIRDHLVQSESGGVTLPGSYFRTLKPNDPTPTVCFTGGTSDCKVNVDEGFHYLSPLCGYFNNLINLISFINFSIFH